MSRRQFLSLTGGVALTLGISSCASGGGGGGGLKVAWSGNPVRDKLINSALDDAQTKLGGAVERESGAGGQFSDKIAAQLAGGGGPDIWITQILALANFSSKSAARKLTEFVPKPIDMNSWDRQAVFGGQVGGEQFAISTGSNTFMAVYDPDLIKKAGLTTLKPDWTWDDLKQVSTAIAAANPGMAGVGDFSSDIQTFQVYLRSHGGDLFSGDGKFLPTADDVATYWNYWEQLRAAHATTTPEIASKFAAGSDITQHALVLKKAAIAFDYSNRLTAIEGVAGKTLSFTTYPQADRPGMFIRPSLLWMIGGRSKRTDKAAELINLLVNDQGVSANLENNLGLPDNPQIFAGAKAKATATAKRVFDYIELAKKSYTTELKAVVFPAGTNDLQAAFSAQAQAVAFKQVSVADGAKTVVDAAQKVGQR